MFQIITQKAQKTLLRIQVLATSSHTRLKGMVVNVQPKIQNPNGKRGG
jgi:hypothetical protein